MPTVEEEFAENERLIREGNRGVPAWRVAHEDGTLEILSETPTDVPDGATVAHGTLVGLTFVPDA